MRISRLALLGAFVPFLLRCGGTDTPATASGTDGAPSPSTTSTTTGTATGTASAPTDASRDDARPGPEAGPPDAGEDAEEPPPPPPPLPTTSPGCGRAASASPAAGDRKTVSVGGVSRSYVLYVPAGYDPARAYPLVAVFHGIGATGAQMSQFVQMQVYAAGNAIVAFPDARGGAWDIGGTADLDFFDAMTGAIEDTLCVNQQRVFGLGFSYGAYMTNYLGCNRSATVRAIVAADGGFAGAGCGGTAALVYHRREDDNEPVANGVAARNTWLGLNGCASTSKPAGAPLQGLGCVTYDGCGAGTPVVWCEDTATSPYKHDFRDVYRVPVWNWLDQL